MKMSNSFTLIEILVVIVVIGVLSAFILVGMSSITRSANIAKSQAFLNSMDNSLLLGRVSQWKFDERTSAGHGDTFIDSWGNNTGTLSTGDGTNNKVSTACPSGKCLSFDGTDDYVDCGGGTTLIAGSSLKTVSAWIYVTGGVGIFRAIVSPTSANYFHFQLHSSDYLSTLFYGPDTQVNSTTLFNTANYNKWFNVVAIWDGTYARLYINGIQDGISTADSGSISAATSNIFIGQGYSGGRRFQGIIDDVRIYNQAIPTSQIQQNYFVGINKLFKNNGISLNEFNQRIVELKSSLAGN